jgi:hypothetical protein
VFRRTIKRRLLSSLLAAIAVSGASALAQEPTTPPPPRFPTASAPAQTAPAAPTAPGTPARPAAPTTPTKPAPADQPLLRFTRNVPGESSVIDLAADEVVTWYEADQTINVLLRGSVLVSQAGIHVHCQQAVARLDLKYYRERGIWLLDLYAEGNVKLDGSESKESGRALVDLATRGEIKLHSAKNKVNQTVQSNDPVYRRAIAERAQAQMQPATTIQPVSGTTTAKPMMLPIGLTPELPAPPPASYSPYAPPASPMPSGPRSQAPAADSGLAVPQFTMTEPGLEGPAAPFCDRPGAGACA